MKYLFAFSICLTSYLVKGQDFETLCKTRVDTEETPGISVGIYENGKTSYYAFGQSNVAAHEAVSSKTFFEIGSITKTFTTSVLSYLVNEKILKLNDPAQNYLPSTITLPDRNGKQITLLHLASAQSGLPRMPSNFAPANPNNPYIDYTSKELAAFLNKCELSTDPGKQYEYSNLGMGLLGFILANQMKTTYSKLIQEIILTPLGMEQTFISGERKTNNLFATGYNDSKPVEPWTWTGQSVMVGAGGIVSNAEDMMKYAIAQLSDNPDKLSLAFQQAHAEVADAIGASIQIAMGWHIKDHQYIWHNGGTGGFRSFIGFDPKTKRAIVILTNSTIGADDLGFHWLNNSYPLKKIKTPITIDAAKLKEYDGIYEISPQFKITVKTEGTSLLGQATGQPQFTMHSDSTDRFYLKVAPVSILFSRDKKGKIINLKLRQNGAWMEGKKIN